jgi:hypothetical protein
VDALGIIQEDTADWEREAKKIATVYTMATVTIIAASSPSCHSGFFHVDLGSVRLDSRLPPQHQLVARRVNKSRFHRFPEETGTPPGGPNCRSRVDIPGGVPCHPGSSNLPTTTFNGDAERGLRACAIR